MIQKPEDVKSKYSSEKLKKMFQGDRLKFSKVLKIFLNEKFKATFADLEHFSTIYDVTEAQRKYYIFALLNQKEDPLTKIFNKVKSLFSRKAQKTMKDKSEQALPDNSESKFQELESYINDMGDRGVPRYRKHSYFKYALFGVGVAAVVLFTTYSHFFLKNHYKDPNITTSLGQRTQTVNKISVEDTIKILNVNNIQFTNLPVVPEAEHPKLDEIVEDYTVPVNSGIEVIEVDKEKDSIKLKYTIQKEECFTLIAKYCGYQDPNDIKGFVLSKIQEYNGLVANSNNDYISGGKSENKGLRKKNPIPDGLIDFVRAGAVINLNLTEEEYLNLLKSKSNLTISKSGSASIDKIIKLSDFQSETLKDGTSKLTCLANDLPATMPEQDIIKEKTLPKLGGPDDYKYFKDKHQETIFDLFTYKGSSIEDISAFVFKSLKNDSSAFFNKEQTLNLVYQVIKEGMNDDSSKENFRVSKINGLKVNKNFFRSRSYEGELERLAGDKIRLMKRNGLSYSQIRLELKTWGFNLSHNNYNNICDNKDNKYESFTNNNRELIFKLYNKGSKISNISEKIMDKNSSIDKTKTLDFIYQVIKDGLNNKDYKNNFRVSKINGLKFSKNFFRMKSSYEEINKLVGNKVTDMIDNGLSYSQVRLKLKTWGLSLSRNNFNMIRDYKEN